MSPNPLPLPPPMAEASPSKESDPSLSPPAALRRGLLRYGLALILELPICIAVLSGRLHVTGAVLLLLLHAFACGLGAWALHSMMPPSQQNPRLPGLLFLFVVAFFLPLFGGLGMLGGILAEYFYPKRKVQPWLSVGLPELPYQVPNIAARPEYGDGALSAMLRYCTNPERRVAAVLAARRLRDHSDAEVLRLALTDKVDDVRLLAYSVLDHREQAFNARLKSLIAQLQLTPADQRAKLHKRLAQIQFEMIHLGLARGELQAYLLQQARTHIDAALTETPDDAESLFLLGTLALKQDELAIAEKAFLRAQLLGMALEKVLPYLAEVAFRQQRFGIVAHYLRAIDPFYFHMQPALNGVAAHWLLEERRENRASR